MLICETVNICNNSCVICADAVMTRERSIMPVSLFRRVLDSYVDMGGGYLSLTPVVGDIFMDPYLRERIAILEEYRERGINSLSVTTNAVLARKYARHDLKNIVDAFDKILISVYGRNAEEYKTMTRRNGFDDMIESVKQIISLIDDRRKVRIGFRLLMDYSVQELATWVQDTFGEAIGFHAVNTYANWGNIDTSQKLPHAGKWLSHADNITQCFIPLLAMQVFSSGHVSFCPCCDYNAVDDLSLGNILDTDLIELYNSDKTGRLWNFEIEMPPFCSHCTFHRSINKFSEFQWVFERPLDFIGG
ncbi:MAG: radical SAM protein [Dissulfurispiraceae bacterium]